MINIAKITEAVRVHEQAHNGIYHYSDARDHLIELVAQELRQSTPAAILVRRLVDPISPMIQSQARKSGQFWSDPVVLGTTFAKDIRENGATHNLHITDLGTVIQTLLDTKTRGVKHVRMQDAQKQKFTTTSTILYYGDISAALDYIRPALGETYKVLHVDIDTTRL